MKHRLCLAAALTLYAVSATTLQSQTFTFSMVADTNTPIPESNGTFASFVASGAAIDAGDVVFSGFGADFLSGIYADIGGLRRIADTTMPVPGAGVDFGDFGPAAIRGGIVTFKGGRAPSVQGVYLDEGSGLTRVVDQDSPFPGGPIEFWGDATVNDQGDVAFQAINSTPAIYTVIGEEIITIANNSTPIPDAAANFQSFGPFPKIDGDNVAFLGIGPDRSGIYKNIADGLVTVAGIDTPIPGGTGNFTLFFDDPAFSGENVAFSGHGDAGQVGIYTDVGGLSRVADKNTPIPEGDGSFTSLQGPAMDDGNVAFLGSGERGHRGIYTDLGGTLTKVIQRGDMLHGNEVTSLGLGRLAISGNQIVFSAFLSDDSSGIFVATMDSPLAADFDSDGDVDSFDQTTLITNWTGAINDGSGGATRAQGDADGDGDVDVADRTQLTIDWTGALTGVENLAAEFADPALVLGGASQLPVVPEPSGMVSALMALSCFGWCRRNIGSSRHR